MATVNLVASDIMNLSASLLNDTARTTYGYSAQLPYLQMALNELQEMYELNDISVTQVSSAIIQVDAGTTVIPFNNGPGLPSLPSDLIEPQQLWERERDIPPWVPMSKREYVQHNLEDYPIPQFVYYTWQDNKIILLEATQNNDIKIDYIKDLFTTVLDENTPIAVINAQTFLAYRTASLVAEFIERNEATANKLEIDAVLAIDRATGIAIKGKQNIFTRRRPFRSGYKRRGWTQR